MLFPSVCCYTLPDPFSLQGETLNIKHLDGGLKLPEVSEGSLMEGNASFKMRNQKQQQQQQQHKEQTENNQTSICLKCECTKTLKE